MTTPCPTFFFLSPTTPRDRVFTPFIIIFDSDNEISTLPIRAVPPSPDRIPALYVYPLNSSDDSSEEDLSDATMLLHTQSALTSVVYPSPTQSLPASLALANQLKKEILMPLMNRWRATPSSIDINYFHQSNHPHLVRDPDHSRHHYHHHQSILSHLEIT
nr:hypothetical protein [Tanacetum cinerariifolium]